MNSFLEGVKKRTKNMKECKRQNKKNEEGEAEKNSCLVYLAALCQLLFM
jgi:hypothetical protein